MQKVFLVDDSPLVRERIAQMVEALPQLRLVGEAAGVPEAINGILAAKPDLVLLDLSLGNGSGFDVLSAVHRREPGIAFYMLSNFASQPYRRHAERLGARGFFDKSTDLERLRSTLMGVDSCPPSSH
jgi:DNA-binding NarL/FixJ family response regulator